MKTKLLLFVMSVALLSGCSKSHDEDSLNLDGKGTEIRVASTLKGTVTPKTYASGTTWDVGDNIGVYVLKNRGNWTTPTDTLFSNVKYVLDDSPSWTPTTNYNAFKSTGTVLYYPVDNSEVKLTAYYPYNLPSAENVLSLDVSNQDPQKNIDLLYAPLTTGSHKKTTASIPVDLTFNHKLSKLVLYVVKGTGITTANITTGLTVTLHQFIKDGSFDLTDGTVNVGTNPANFAPVKMGTITDAPNGITPDAQYEAILIPQTLTSGNQQIEFNIGSDKFVWNLSAKTGSDLSHLDSGKKYVYTITINRNEILADGNIVDWVEGTSGAGIAE